MKLGTNIFLKFFHSGLYALIRDRWLWILQNLLDNSFIKDAVVSHVFIE